MVEGQGCVESVDVLLFGEVVPVAQDDVCGALDDPASAGDADGVGRCAVCPGLTRGLS